MPKTFNLYGGREPGEFGTYSLTEAARILDLPTATLRSWVRGRTYETEGGERLFKPLLEPAETDPVSLSFINLIEAHVLKAIRRKHKIPMSKVRKALDYLSHELDSKHPLAEKLETDNLDLFIDRFGQLINLTRSGQLAMREVLSAYLERIKRDVDGRPLEFYPLSREDFRQDPALILVNPRISFGRPVVRGTGVPTSVLAERYKAGDSLTSLAKDYDLTKGQIEEAIRYELQPAA